MAAVSVGPTGSEDTGGRGTPWLSALFVLPYALAMMVGIGLVVTGHTAQIPAVPAMLVFGLVGLVFAVRCWRCRTLDRRTRRAWGVISSSYVLLLIFPILFQLYPPIQFPGPGDVVRIGFTLSLSAGLLAVPLRKSSPADRRKVGFDVATVVLGGFIVLWYLVVGPGLVTTGISIGKIIAASAYPATDLLLTFSIARALLRATDPSTRRPLSLLAGAAGAFVVGDVYLGYVRSHGLSVRLIDTWPLLMYLTAHFLLASAGLRQYRQAARSRVAGDGQRRVPVSSRLPYAAVVLGYCMMLLAMAVEKRLFPWTGLVLGSIGITAVVVARQMVVQRESHRMAVTDMLTGLANRAQLYDTLARSLERANHTGRITAVILADMNGFKQVNDTLGHQAGDQMLVAFAEVLRRAVLGSDVVARRGGDEFAIVLHDIGEIANAEAVLRRIRTGMEQPVVLAGRSMTLRASFGLALGGPGQSDVDDLLHRADLAMYEAKRTNNLDWVRYEPGMGIQNADPLEHDLHHAVDAGQLRVVYQPIVDLVDGRVCGVEALARWQHPIHGAIPPAEFIPMATRIAVIGEIGEWVLDQACRQAERWRRPDLRRVDLSINISADQLARSGFAESVLAIVERTGFDPRHLILELSNCAVVVDDDNSIRHLVQLRDAGVRIALDDFGSGSSSVCHLTRLPVDVLKLDGRIVSELDRTAAGAAVAGTLLQLGERLNLPMVAKGVEDAHQARELIRLGCRSAQGYFLARPMPPDALTALLDRTAQAVPALATHGPPL